MLAATVHTRTNMKYSRVTEVFLLQSSIYNLLDAFCNELLPFVCIEHGSFAGYSIGDRHGCERVLLLASFGNGLSESHNERNEFRGNVKNENEYEPR